MTTNTRRFPEAATRQRPVLDSRSMDENVFYKPPVHGRLANWLGSQMVDRLLDYAQSQRDNFNLSGIGRKENKRVDLTLRRSMALKQLGDLEDELVARARAALPVMFQQLGAARFEPSRFELEVVAHGDGAFYARHRDTNISSGPPLGNRRVISAVYYFHRLPIVFGWRVADLSLCRRQ